MATLQDYKDVAPTVMATGEFTKTQIENKLATVPSAPAIQPEPKVTKAKVVAVFNTVFAHHSVQKGITENGGFLMIAKANNLTIAQVKLIIKELSAMNNVFLETK